MNLIVYNEVLYKNNRTNVLKTFPNLPASRFPRTDSISYKNNLILVGKHSPTTLIAPVPPKTIVLFVPARKRSFPQPETPGLNRKHPI